MTWHCFSFSKLSLPVMTAVLQNLRKKPFPKETQEWGILMIQSYLLTTNFLYQPISLQYSLVNVEQPIKIDWVLYTQNWECPINGKAITMLKYPIIEGHNFMVFWFPKLFVKEPLYSKSMVIFLQKTFSLRTIIRKCGPHCFSK